MCFHEMVVKDLHELATLGVKVSERALAVAADPEAMAEYNNMSVCDAADLLLTLY
jgi:hypothetical protein